MGTRQGRGRGLRATAVACVLVLGAAALPASAQSGARIETGAWDGYVSFDTTVGTFRGGFEIVSAGGSLDGTFSWSGPATISGVISGRDTRPVFDVTQAISGGAVIDDATGRGEVRLTHATCERVEGVAENVEVGRFVDFGSVVWFAVREGAVPDPFGTFDFFEAIDDLRAQVRRIETDLRNEVIPADVAVTQLLLAHAAAERTASALARFDSCPNDGRYRSLIAAETLPLLEALAANESLPLLPWSRLVLRLGSAGISGEGDVGLRSIFETRLDDAIGEGDLIALESLSDLAAVLGWRDLARRADLAIAEVS